MIKIFFNDDGYYIIGENIEISRRCFPALTDRGDRIFQPLHHAYRICFLALKEIQNSNDDIMVYSDNRIIDEISGSVTPLDETCQKWRRAILHFIIPSIKSVVFFRKRSSNEINANITKGHNKMLALVANESMFEKQSKNNNNRLINKLVKNWFGVKNAE